MVFVSIWNKEKLLLNYCLCPPNRQRQLIKLQPTSWHYPLITYIRKNYTKRIKIFLTLIMAFNPRCVWGAPNFSIMTLSSSKLNLPVSLTLNLKKIINFDFKKEISAQVICHFFYGGIQVLNRPDKKKNPANSKYF